MLASASLATGASLNQLILRLGVSTMPAMLALLMFAAGRRYAEAPIRHSIRSSSCRQRPPEILETGGDPWEEEDRP